MLGSYRSDAEQFDAAEDAYSRALACSDVDRDSVLLNRAILATRRRNPEEALRIIAEIADPTLSTAATSARMRALELLGRTPEAIQIGLTALDAGVQPAGGDRAGLIAQIAHLRILAGHEKSSVRSFLARYWSRDDDSPELLAAFREVDGVPAAGGCAYFRLLLQARLLPGHPEHGDAEGYYTNFHAVAPSAKEALPFVERLINQPVELRVATSEALEKRSEGFQGVYWCKPGRTYYAS